MEHVVGVHGQVHKLPRGCVPQASTCSCMPVESCSRQELGVRAQRAQPDAV